MLLSGKDALLDVQQHRCALGAFTLYNIELAQAVISAAEKVGAPVLIQAGSSGFHYVDEEVLGAVALTMATQAPTPVGVHLDHSRSLDEVRRCQDRGYTSVMVDGSHLPFSENAALASQAVAIAAPYGAWVQAELGVVSGDEDRSIPVSASPGTDPHQAKQFGSATGVDALAVAIGNVHGMSPTPVSLDLNRLRKIRDQTTVPLVLHGASGLPQRDVVAAIEIGVAKVNVNAEVRGAYIRALTGHEQVGDDIAAFSDRGIAAATAVVADKLQLFARNFHESEQP